MESTTRQILICVVISFFLAVSSNSPLITLSHKNVAANMNTTTSSTDKEVKAFVHYMVDGYTDHCFRSLAENKPWLMVKLKDYYPIFWVRIITSEKISLERVKIFVGDINTRGSRESFTLCAFKEKIEKGRLLGFGCNELYVYGNAVKISSESSHSILSLCEIEVYADPYGNIALNQFTKSLIEGNTGYANDGIKRDTCFQTAKQGPWWSVELGANVRVSMVFILTSGNGLQGADILVGKDNMKETDLCTTIPQYDHKANYFECKKTVVGSFLNITRAREPPGQFTLCEVEVFQTKITNLAVHRFTKSKTSDQGSFTGCDHKIETVNVTAALQSQKLTFLLDEVFSTEEWWAVDLVAICQVHLVRVVTDENYKPDEIGDLAIKVDIGNKVIHEQNSIASQHGGFGKGEIVANVDYPTKESVQTITLPKGTKARYVTLELSSENPILKFREVEVYNGPLLEFDECKRPHICPQNYRCENKRGSFFCECNGGYKPTGPSEECKDTDECKLEKNICGSNSVCENTQGSFKCYCLSGFKSTNNGKDCSDTDECSEKKGRNHCGDEAECNNTLGSFQCICRKGFSFDDVKRKCFDIDECAVGLCGLNMLCGNTEGSYSCSCRKGYRAKKKQFGCRDIDECKKQTHSCPKFSTCTNNNGGYDCSCEHGFEKTAQGTCSKICNPKCGENSYCENEKCLCRRGFFMGFGFKCQPSEGLLGSGMSLKSPAKLLTTALLWRLALI